MKHCCISAGRRRGARCARQASPAAKIRGEVLRRLYAECGPCPLKRSGIAACIAVAAAVVGVRVEEMEVDRGGLKLTHFLLATLVTGALDARLSLLFGLNEGVVLVADTAGTAFDSAALPLDRIMAMEAHRASRAHGRGRRGAADDDVAIHAFNGQRSGSYIPRLIRRDRTAAVAPTNAAGLCWGWGC